MITLLRRCTKSTYQACACKYSAVLNHDPKPHKMCFSFDVSAVLDSGSGRCCKRYTRFGDGASSVLHEVPALIARLGSTALNPKN